MKICLCSKVSLFSVLISLSILRSYSAPSVPSAPSPGTTSSPGPVLSSNTVTLSWNPSSGATYYDLGVRNMDTGLLVVDRIVTSTSHTVTLAAGQRYRWNVAAGNSAGLSSYTGQRYFQTPSSASVPSTPSSPSPGTTSSPGPTLNSRTVTLSWNPSSGATYYDLGVRNMDTGVLVVDRTTTSTSHTVTLAAGQRYRWNVAAGNSAGLSSYTGHRYFQTPANTASPAPVIQSLNPASPIQADAANGLQTITIHGTNFNENANINLTWTGQPGFTLPGERIQFISGNQIRIHIRLGASADTWSVRIRNPDGQDSNIFPFNVSAPSTTANPVTRSQVLETARAYANFEWICSAANVNSGFNSFFAGQRVLGVAYHWSGSDYLSVFSQKMASGIRAGSSLRFPIPVPESYQQWGGVDCSGFVTRCWNSPVRLYTGTIPEVTSVIQWAELKPGDVLNLVSADIGHVRIFEQFHETKAGYVWVYEAAASDGVVRRNEHRISTMQNQGYIPRRYNHIVDDAASPAPSILDFQLSATSISVGQTISLSYHVASTGGSSLRRVELWRASGNGTPSDPSWAEIGRQTLSGAGPVSGTLQDTPPAAGTYWYGIHVVDSADRRTNEREAGKGPLQLQVASVQRTIRLSGSLDFGDVAVGTSQSRILTLHNDGSAPLTIHSLSMPARFSASWSGSIPPGGFQDVPVTFTPAAVTFYQGTVTVNSNRTDGNHTRPCSGRGAANSATAPAIITPPLTRTVSAPDGASFYAVASGEAPLSFQWQRSVDRGTTWSNIQGAASSIYQISSTNSTMNGYRYRVLISNRLGSAISTPAVLWVEVSSPEKRGSFGWVHQTAPNRHRSIVFGELEFASNGTDFTRAFSHSLQANLRDGGGGIRSPLYGNLTPNAWDLEEWVISEFYGLVHFGRTSEQYAGWVNSERFGWMRFLADAGGNSYLWVHKLQSWFAVNPDGSFHSFDFGRLAPENGSLTRYNSRIGILIDDDQNPPGWLRSDRFGFVWFARDGTGTWFWSSTRNEWIGITPQGGLWSTAEGRFL